VGQAEFVWGTALSIEGADLPGAAEHLHAAEQALTEALAAEHAGPSATVQLQLAQVKFELGSLAAQQGQLEAALALYGETLALARAAGTPESTVNQALALNNLAYHQHLLAVDTGNAERLAEAARQAEAGLKLAQAHGLLWAQTFLHSTWGEIALARGALDEAEQAFTEGLALAERLRVPERIAGHTANLGRVALARGEEALALYRLSTALAQAQALGVRHLAAQVRLWLAPLLPPAEAEAHRAEVRAFAAATGRRRLLAEAGG
jgi:tetratricopeptide (TPR) repeat protein